METTQVVLRGTVRPDGTLALDDPLEFPAGPVVVTVRAVPAPAPAEAGENWLQFLIRSRAELEAAGHKFMNDAEMAEYIEELRGGEDRIDVIYREMEAERRRREE